MTGMPISVAEYETLLDQDSDALVDKLIARIKSGSYLVGVLPGHISSPREP